MSKLAHSCDETMEQIERLNHSRNQRNADMFVPGYTGRKDGGPDHVAAYIKYVTDRDSVAEHAEQAVRAGLHGAETVEEQCRRIGTAQAYRLLARDTRALRYWTTGWDEDDTEANHWRDHYGRRVDHILVFLYADR